MTIVLCWIFCWAKIPNRSQSTTPTHTPVEADVIKELTEYCKVGVNCTAPRPVIEKSDDHPNTGPAEVVIAVVLLVRSHFVVQSPERTQGSKEGLLPSQVKCY